MTDSERAQVAAPAPAFPDHPGKQTWETVRAAFDQASVDVEFRRDPRLNDWPVVYLLDRPGKRVYVGETRHAAERMKQHLANPGREGLTGVQVLVDPTFNKSAALDLEALLIQLIAADERLHVDNLNAGIVNADYHGRDWYQQRFEAIVGALTDSAGDKLLSASVEDLKNSDLYKLSPFKSPTAEQFHAIESVVGRLLDRVKERRIRDDVVASAAQESPFVVSGAAGTGKTIVAIFLIKLLMDIATRGADAEMMRAEDEPGGLSTLLTAYNQSLLEGMRIGFVIPQQSLRESVRRVFRRISGLRADMVLSPMQVGSSAQKWDVLIVDEAHRLRRYSNRGNLNARFQKIHASMFGAEDRRHTEIDWIRARSRFQVFLMDAEQSVRTSDVPREDLDALLEDARTAGQYFALGTQMRVAGGSDYLREIKNALAGRPVTASTFSGYDFRIYDDPVEMSAAIRRRDREYGLARMVAGFAWDWKTKKLRGSDREGVYDIEVDGFRGVWNSQDRDWIASENSVNEVGSIHTVQGYDLNYAGVIIGADIYCDPESGEIRANVGRWRDKGAKQNNKLVGKRFTDAERLEYIRHAYEVLMTRGMQGTYVYIEDPGLRDLFMRCFPTAVAGRSGAA